MINAQTFLEDKGVRLLDLKVLAGSESARCFYASLGFQVRSLVISKRLGDQKNRR